MLKFDQNGLIPAVIQDYQTGEVLMVAYMNEESFEETLKTGRTVFYSRSRQEIWRKGETSGNVQTVKEISVDCDADCLLIKVDIGNGAACHTGNRSCFYRVLEDGKLKEQKQQGFGKANVLYEVTDVIKDRRKNPKEGSYTNYLFDKGIDKILKKVGEEATEIVIAAKNPDPQEVKYEISDFLYHVMVLMAEKGVSWKEITKELSRR